MATKSTPIQHRAHPANAWWSDRAWPVVAGTTTAVGLVGFAATVGWLAAVLMGTCVWLLVTLAVYSTFGEGFVEAGAAPGIGLPRALHLGLVSAVGMVVLLGLCNVSPFLGVVVATVVAVTSPPATQRLGARWAAARPGPAPRRASEPTQAVVDAAFAAIVSELREDSRDDGSERG